MKNVLTMCVFVIAFFTLALGSGIAQQNKKGTPYCPETFIFVTGIVMEKIPVVDKGVTLCPEPGTVNTDGECSEVTITIQGLGPTSFWDDLGVAKPVEGETITVEYYTCDGCSSNIATAIIFDGGITIITLRNVDCEACWVVDCN